MRSVLYLATALAVMGLAFWAYRENYRTQAQIDRMQDIQNEIAVLRQDLGTLRAEWAYLNRPERLQELVDLNFDRLRLVPVQANQFGTGRNVDYPAPTPPEAPPADGAEAGAADGTVATDGPAAAGAETDRPATAGPATAGAAAEGFASPPMARPQRPAPGTGAASARPSTPGGPPSRPAASVPAQSQTDE